MAVFSTISTINNTLYGDQNGEFGVGGHDWSANAKATTSSLGLSYGYRQRKDLLLYTGLAVGQVDVSGKVIHEESDDKTSPKATYDIDSKKGTTQTIGAGFVLGNEGWNFDLSANHSRIEIDGVSKADNYGAIRVNYLFGLPKSIQRADIDPSSEPVQTIIFPKESWQARDFLATGASFFVGFGLGQAIQNRWSESGLTFAIIDGASVITMVSALSNCVNSSCEDDVSTLALANVVLTVSRVWQVIDVIQDAGKTVVAPQSQVYLLPTQDGAQLTYAHRF